MIRSGEYKVGHATIVIKSGIEEGDSFIECDGARLEFNSNGYPKEVITSKDSKPAAAPAPHKGLR